MANRGGPPPGVTSPAPGGAVRGQAKETMGDLWRKHPWWFLGGFGAVAVFVFVVWQHRQLASKGQGGRQAGGAIYLPGTRTVIYRNAPAPGGGGGGGSDDSDDQRLMQQIASLEAALEQFTDARRRDRDRGDSGGMPPGHPLPPVDNPPALPPIGPHEGG